MTRPLDPDSSHFEHPTFVRLEVWSEKKREWVATHQGLNLLRPKAYVERMAANGKVARVVDPETGQIFQVHFPEDDEPDHEQECEFCMGTICDGDGSCLI